MKKEELSKLIEEISLNEYGYDYSFENLNSYQKYKEMIRDDAIYRAIQIRLTNALDWHFDFSCEEEREREFMRENFREIKFAMHKLLYYSLVFGDAIAEIVWKINNGKYYINKIYIIENPSYNYR